MGAYLGKGLVSNSSFITVPYYICVGTLAGPAFRTRLCSLSLRLLLVIRTATPQQLEVNAAQFFGYQSGACVSNGCYCRCTRTRWLRFGPGWNIIRCDKNRYTNVSQEKKTEKGSRAPLVPTHASLWREVRCVWRIVGGWTFREATAALIRLRLEKRLSFDFTQEVLAALLQLESHHSIGSGWTLDKRLKL